MSKGNQNVSLSAAAVIDSGLRVRMCAAIWGTCYPNEREFDMEWKQGKDGLLTLVDAAESGAYSFQVEGVIVRHLMSRGAIENPLGIKINEAGIGKCTLKREDWSAGIATPEQWETLRSDLYSQFYKDGSGFYAHDLKFSDLAINWLKAGNPCQASACSELPD